MSHVWWLQHNRRRSCITLAGHVILRWIVSVSSLCPLTSGKIWLAWVQWHLCGKPGNDGKCWISIGWVKMTEQISAVSEVTESRWTFRGHIVDWHFWFVDATFRFGDMRCWVRKSRKVVKNLMFLHPEFGRRAPNLFVRGICKMTPLPTYWPSLVEIPWLIFYLCWRN